MATKFEGGGGTAVGLLKNADFFAASLGYIWLP